MAPIEDRLRAMLQERVDDVTTAPALYRHVKARAARRRRRRLLTAVPAGAAAFGLALAVPLLLDGSPDVPRIDDLATQLPIGAITPERVVTVDTSGAIELIDLADGSTIHSYGQTRDPEVVPEIEVAPSDRSPVPAVHAAFAMPAPEGGDDTGSLTVGAFWIDGAGDRVNLRGGSRSAAGGRFAVSPDGRWTASLLRTEDADRWALELASSPTDDDDAVQVVPGVVVPAGSVVQDWTGSLDAAGSISQVTVITPDGLLLGFPLTVDDGAFAWGEQRTEHPIGGRAVAAYASSHLDAGADFVLETAGAGAVVQAVDGERILGEVDVTDLVGDQIPSVVALDAWGDTATLSGPDGSWLLTYDDEGRFGRFAQPVALPEGTVRAAPVGKGVAEEEQTDEVEATEAPETSDDEATHVTPPGVPTVPIVQADASTITLRPGGDGAEVPLLDLADQDAATVVEVAVRPGSTVDDLTVAALVTEDGVTGLRYVEVVDGEAQPPVTVDDPVLAPNARADSGLTLHGMAWTPDGASLTWLERIGDDGPTVLRVTGWDDGPGTGEGATDSDGFDAPALDAIDARLVDWVDTANGWFVRFLATDGEPGTWVWRVERQGDGSLSAADEGPRFTSVAAAEGPDARWEVDALHAFAGYDEPAQPTWLLVDRSVDGLTITRPLGLEGDLDPPPEIAGGSQLDAAWMHRLADDGVLLGAEGRAFLHGADGWVDLGPAVDAEPVR